MKRLLVSLAGMMLVSGCATYSLEELRRVEPTGTPLQKALARHYKEFAISEETQYDWIDSMYFADKGLRSAYGKDVMPEELASWNIPQDKLPEMVTAREALMQVLTGPMAQAQPEVVARAQYYFDCWVEQQEEGWQEKDIAYCRDGFMDTMETLTGSAPAMHKADEMPEATADEPAPVQAPVPETAQEHEAVVQPATYAYIVFFVKKETEISASGRQVIEEVLKMVKSGDAKYSFILNAHTDTVGDTMENLKLTEERAQAVRAALVEGGVSESQIEIFAYGESDTPVKTADEVDESANQRVEIFLNE